jgi:hypothetical protein
MKLPTLSYNDTTPLSIGNLIHYNQRVKHMFLTPKWAISVAFQLIKFLYLQNTTFTLTQPLHQNRPKDLPHFILEVPVYEQIHQLRFYGYLPLRLIDGAPTPSFLPTHVTLKVLSSKLKEEVIWKVPSTIPQPTFYKGESVFINDYDYVYKENGKYLGKWDSENEVINPKIPEQKFAD